MQVEDEEEARRGRGDRSRQVPAHGVHHRQDGRKDAPPIDKTQEQLESPADERRRDGGSNGRSKSRARVR